MESFWITRCFILVYNIYVDILLDALFKFIWNWYILLTKDSSIWKTIKDTKLRNKRQKTYRTNNGFVWKLNLHKDWYIPPTPTAKWSRKTYSESDLFSGVSVKWTMIKQYCATNILLPLELCQLCVHMTFWHF